MKKTNDDRREAGDETYGEIGSDRERKLGACKGTHNWNTQHTTAMSTAGTLEVIYRQSELRMPLIHTHMHTLHTNTPQSTELQLLGLREHHVNLSLCTVDILFQGFDWLNGSCHFLMLHQSYFPPPDEGMSVGSLFPAMNLIHSEDKGTDKIAACKIDCLHSANPLAERRGGTSFKASGMSKLKSFEYGKQKGSKS